MREDEVAIRASLSLAQAIREQYIHQAHCIISGDSEHIEHYERWVEQISERLRELAPLVPSGERWRVEHVATGSQELDQLFTTSILPALARDDRASVVRTHRQLEALSTQSAEHADHIARSVEQRMAHAHIAATRATRRGLAVGAVGAVLVITLSIVYTIRLRRAVVQPLEVLANAAGRFGGGDLSVRVAAIGEGELRAVAQAFDRMVGEIEDRERRLVASERMAAIGQLAAGVAHEINNPIGVIRGYLKTMTPDTAAELLEDELKILDEEAAACQRIAEDLVTYSRAPELQLDSIEMDGLLSETVRRFAERNATQGHRIDLDLTPGTVLADAARLRQVMVNLLLNAAQASPPESAIHVTGRPEDDGGYEFVIADRGPGIAAEDRARVFEPFFSKRSGGSGLGLSVCRGIVQAHGGSIWIEDLQGRGTAFHVEMPASPANGSLESV
jgi:signal transduction histidine kinase